MWIKCNESDYILYIYCLLIGLMRQRKKYCTTGNAKFAVRFRNFTLVEKEKLFR